ncbi:hypothetical protein NE865_07804 [Phthorimaea operculella]|nr:hypothetical protein NE865_07804 [Phthorimaea operculella]
MYQNEPGVYELYKADTGAIKFKVRYPRIVGYAVFALTSKQGPKKDLYRVFFGPTYRFIDITQDGIEESRIFNLTEPIGSEFKEFWLTWHSSTICLGIAGQSEPILTYHNSRIMTMNIGYIKFYLKCGMNERLTSEWICEASPVILRPPKEKAIAGGKLHWVSLAENNEILPHDSLIGGFQSEPLYIIRASHNGSLCPGKYLRSQNCGYVPWGGREFAKRSNLCEVLCGYNAKWIKTKGNCIPENAFVAGYSEVRREPLYVARAMVNNHLLVGKVHVIYSTCYLPNYGKEIEVGEYEILVSGDTNPRGILNLKRKECTERNTVQRRQRYNIFPRLVSD